MLITVICDGWGILHFKPERCDDDPGTGHSPIIEGTEPKEQHRDGR